MKKDTTRAERSLGRSLFMKLVKAGLLAIFIVAAAPPSPLLNDIKTIEDSLTCVERDVRRNPAAADVLQDNAQRKISIFKDSRLVNTLQKMKVLSGKITTLTKQMEKNPEIYSNNIALLVSLSEKYTAILTRIHILYATGVHSKGHIDQIRPKTTEDFYTFKVEIPYDFDDLKPYNLTIAKFAGFPVRQKLPYNVSHKNLNEFEVSLSEQEKVLAEYAALSHPKSNHDFAKLVHHSVLREGFVNRWALQRLKGSYFKSTERDPNRCGAELLSFKLGTDLKIANVPLYQELVNTDMFTVIQDSGAKISEKITKTIGDSDTYIALMKTSYSSGANKAAFDAFSKKASDEKVAEWYAEAAKYVTATEVEDWTNNGADVINSSSTPRDATDATSIALRMTTNAWERRKWAVKEQIWQIGAQLVGMTDRDSFEKTIDAELEKSKKMWQVAVGQVVIADINTLLSEKNLNTIAYKRKMEKVDNSLEAARDGIQSAYELNIINKMLANDEESVNEKSDIVKTWGKTGLVSVLKLEPKTPEDLQMYYGGKLEEGSSIELRQMLGAHPELKNEIDAFFKQLSETYEKKRETDSDPNLLAKTAARLAYGMQYTMLTNYRLKNKEKYSYIKKDDMLKQYQQPSDATYVAKPAFVPKITAKAGTPDWRAPMAVTDEMKIAQKEKETAQMCGETSGLFGGMWSGSSSSASANSKYDITWVPASQEKDPMDPIKAEIKLFGLMYLNLEPYDAYDKKIASFTKNSQFMPFVKEHKILAESKISASLAQSALLGKMWEYEPPQKLVSGNYTTAEEISDWKDEERPTMYHLAYAWNDLTNTVDDARAKEILKLAVNKIASNDKLETLCMADTQPVEKEIYTDYFKKMYRAASSTRATLTQNKDFKKFDDHLREETRSWGEWWEEEFFGSVWVSVLMWAMMIIPFVGQGFATLMLIVTWVNILTWPLFLVSTAARLQVNFIEMPAQIKFQQAISNSYAGDVKTLMGDSKAIVDKDQLAQDKQINSFSQKLEPVFLVMDFFFAKSVVKDIRREVSATQLRGIIKQFAKMEPAAVKTEKVLSTLSKDEATVAKTAEKTATGTKATMTWAAATKWIPKAGKYASNEVMAALRVKLAEVMPKKFTSLIPEIDQAVDVTTVRLQKARVMIAKDSELAAKLKAGEDVSDLLEQLERPEVEKFANSPTVTEYGMYLKNLIKRFTSKNEFTRAKAKLMLKNHGKTIKELQDLRVLYLSDRIAKYKNIIAKLKAAEASGSSSETLIANFSEEELRLLDDASKIHTFFGPAPVATKVKVTFVRGPLLQMRPYFEASESITARLHPKSAVVENLAKKDAEQYEPQNYYNAADENYSEMSDKDDLKAYYNTLDDVDGTGLDNDKTKKFRKDIDDDLGKDDLNK